MNLRKLHLPSIGVTGLLVGGLLRIFSFVFEWPLALVLISNIVLLIAVAWIFMFDLFPIFLEPFYIIRQNFSRRRSFFVGLLAFFALMQVATFFLPSGPAKDTTTTLAFLGFASAIVWGVTVYFITNFTPLLRYIKRKPREAERITFADIITSMAIIVIPTVFLSFVFLPTGLSGQAQVTPYQVFISSILTNIFIMMYLYLFIIRQHVFTWRQLGLRKVDREDFGRSLTLFLFVCVLIVIFQALLQRLGVPLKEYSFVTKDGAIFALIATVIVSPFAEELYFRGLLFRGLLLHHKPWVAYLTSALLFALLHPPIIVMAEVFFIGILLAFVVRESKSIWPGVLIHALNNALVFGYLLYR